MKNPLKLGKATQAETVGADLAKVLPQLEKPWYLTKHLVQLNIFICILLFSSAGIGYDGSMMNGLQTLPQWRNFFGNPDAPVLGAINAIYPVSKILGLFPARWVADKYGRRMPLLIGLVIMLIGPAIQAASQNLPTFIVSRFIIGVGTVFIQIPSPILITELAYPSHRGKATSLYNTFFYFGAIFAAWSTYGTFRMQSTWAWRIPSVLQAATPALQLAVWWWIPESPRWLIANGKFERARAILTRYHAGGDQDSALVSFELEQIEKTIRQETESEEKPSWLSLVKTAPNRKRLLIAVVLGFFAQWNGVSLVTYYLTLVLNTIGITTVAEQALINGLLQIFNFFTAVFVGALMVDRIGRRKLFLFATGGMGLSYIAWTALCSYFVKSKNESAGRAVLAFIFLTFFFYSSAWTPLPIAYTVEVFPYSSRSRGLTAQLTSTYVGLVTAQLIHPVAIKALAEKYYIVFCCILVCLFAFIWFMFPETKGRSLEEIAEIFENKRVPVPDIIRDSVSASSDKGTVEIVDHKMAKIEARSV